MNLIEGRGAGPAPRQPLVYCDTLIRDRDEMLSLTDMWRAAGADPARQPAEWGRSAQAQDFVDFIRGNLGISQDEVFQAVRGGNDAGTWAHWQVAMAYAKYLSPAFHAWCNEVVRAHMEGRSVALRSDSLAIVDVVELGDRFGAAVGVAIQRAMQPVQDAIERQERALETHGKRLDGLEKFFAHVNRHGVVPSRKRLKDSTKAEHIKMIRLMGGGCPCCRTAQVVGADGAKTDIAEFDHFYANSQADLSHTWLICRGCHAELTRGQVSRQQRDAEFRAYQNTIERLSGRPKLPV